MIRIQNLGKRFRGVAALRDLSLDIDNGDRVALVGANGAGKTTLMRCLLGEYGYRGSVCVNGLEVTGQRTRILQRIGFVPQLPPPLKMPVAQLVDFAACVCASARSQTEAIAAELGLDLDSLRHQPFNKLSGGQKQKILISIALARDLDLLVLDEPAANLDPQARKTFFQLLGERHRHTTLLLSSHRLSEIAALVNRVVELENGRIVVDDRVAAAAELDSMTVCSLVLRRADDAFTRSMQTWGFENRSAQRHWQGRIAAADRLRFLGLLARYASILKTIHLDDEELKQEALANARIA